MAQAEDKHSSIQVEEIELWCRIEMAGDKLCDRPTYRSGSVCLMHFNNPDKDAEAFAKEIERILLAAGEGIADFTRFVFPKANYSNRTLSARCIFSLAKFLQKADFHETRFTHDAQFDGVSFDQNAQFGGAEFAEVADFFDSKFAQITDFCSTKFNGAANFAGATFSEKTYFSGAIFRQNAIFSSATFSQNAQFGAAKFMQAAVFFDALFTQNGSFFNAKFSEEANFVETAFRQEAEFTRATFTKNAVFRSAQFGGNAEFRATVFRKDGDGIGPDFSLARFEKPEAVSFYKTYLGQALFHNCDVSKINFSNVSWRERKQNRKRMVFEEEVKLEEDGADALRPDDGNPDERNYGLIAELYQQLKKNYDDRKDYWTAGDFHYGEMEMKRKSSPRRNKLLRSLHRNLGMVAWYKYASEYGESYVRPLLWLLATLVVFMFLFPVARLNPGDRLIHGATLQRTVSTADPLHLPDLSYWSFSEFARAHPKRIRAVSAFFGNSFMTALYVAAFQRDFYYEPSYPWGRLLAVLEALLTSTLVALFLLALRRQFRR